MNFRWLFFLCLIVSATVRGQHISVKSINWPELGGIQSYVHGEIDGYAIVFGGRLDGLHRRQPFASFDADGHNLQVHLINAQQRKIESWDTHTFPDSIQQQMHSTNACFVQQGHYLIVMGGYGLNSNTDMHMTYPRVLIFDLQIWLNALKTNSNPSAALVFAMNDDRFAVCGGETLLMDDAVVVVGGQRFDGAYNPMGPNNGPGFYQKYTQAVRRFKFLPIPHEWAVQFLDEFYDAERMHRRDFNACPTIIPGSNKQQGAIAYSGVFQPTQDIPYLDIIPIWASGLQPTPNFAQYYNHYQCPTLGIYNEQTDGMRTYFFGGIAQYYDSLGMLVLNNNVPFVQTIACVTENPDHLFMEYKLDQELPGLLGASAEFIPNMSIPSFENGVYDEANFVGDSVLLGYIYGGITAKAPNVFWDNEGDLSSAVNVWMEVWWHRLPANWRLNKHSCNDLQLHVYPNPFDENFQMDVNLAHVTDLEFTLKDLNGQVIKSEKFSNQDVGFHRYVWKDVPHWINHIFFLHTTANGVEYVQKIAFEP